MTGTERIAYDEFGLFHENAAEYGLTFDAPPTVRRETVQLPDGRALSALVWGAASPELVFLHGGAQNAHTWDTVLLALGRPAVAIDLPGHGHSEWRADGGYTPRNMADDVAVAIEALAPSAALIVGMSMGGITTIEVAAHHQRLTRSVVLVDVTPGVNAAKAKAIIDFVDGPQSFPSFQSLLERTIEHNPTRAESSLRRGILHNAHQLDDGSWKWNYDRRRQPGSIDAETGPVAVPESLPLWDDFAAIACPIAVVRGSLSPVVDDEDIAECRRRQPDVRVEVVDGAGHSIQGDRPLELAAIITDVLAN